MKKKIYTYKTKDRPSGNIISSAIFSDGSVHCDCMGFLTTEKNSCQHTQVMIRHYIIGHSHTPEGQKTIGRIGNINLGGAPVDDEEAALMRQAQPSLEPIEWKIPFYPAAVSSSVTLIDKNGKEIMMKGVQVSFESKKIPESPIAERKKRRFSDE